MKVETKLFAYLCVFFAVMTLIYGFWTQWAEPIALTALLLTMLLFLLTGFYLFITAKALTTRLEDNITSAGFRR